MTFKCNLKKINYIAVERVVARRPLLCPCAGVNFQNFNGMADIMVLHVVGGVSWHFDDRRWDLIILGPSVQKYISFFKALAGCFVKEVLGAFPMHLAKCGLDGT